MSTNPRDVVARKAADHFGWRPFDVMAKDKADLRLKVREFPFDVNEATQADCLDFADAILSALQPVVTDEAVEAAAEAMWRAETLSPKSRMACGDGPIQMRPASITA